MARDLRLDINGNSAGGQKALEAAAAAAAAAAHEADKLGDQFRQASRDASELDAKLLETAAAAKVLAKELSKNPASTSLKEQLNATRKTAAELKALRADIIGDSERAATDAARIADRSAKEFSKLTSSAAKDAEQLAAKAKKQFDDLVKDVTQSAPSLGELFSGGPGGFLTSGPGAAIGAPTAVVGTAAIGGLAAVGAGATVAGAGVAGAVLGDPEEFAAKWGPVAADLKQRFLDATYVFRDPGLKEVDNLGTAIKGLDLKGLFAAAVPYVHPLAQGAEEAAGYILDGVKHLTEDAGPAIATFSKDLPEIGKSIGDALDNIGSQAQGGADGLHALDTAIADAVAGVGYFVAGAEAVTGAVHDASQSTEHFFDSIPGWVQVAIPPLALYKTLFDAVTDNSNDGNVAHFGQALAGVAATGNLAADAAAAQADNYGELSKELNSATLSADSLAGAMTDKLIGSLLAGDQATLGFEESLTKVSEALKENKRSLDIHTAAGQADREAVLASVAANVQIYDTMISAGASAQDAAAAYDTNTQRLEANLHAAGLNAGAIQDLIGKYENVPDNVNTNVAVNGLTEAINNLAELLRQINGIHDKSATISVTTVYKTSGGVNVGEGGTRVLKGAYAYGGIRHAASGLIVGPSDPGTLIGEPQTGGELLLPMQGIPQARAASLAQTALRGYGLDVVPRSRIPAGLFGGSGGGGGSGTPQLVYSGGAGGAYEAAFVSALASSLKNGTLQLVVGAGGRIKAA